MEETSEKNPSVQTKGSKNEKKYTEQVMMITLKSCMLKENYGNLMEKHLCVGVYIV
jgi:hypothetical protein